MRAADAAGRRETEAGGASAGGAPAPRVRGGLTPMQASPLRLRRRRSGKPYYARRWEQLDDWLRRRGPVGAGSIEMRQAGISNPSQAAGELVAAGVDVSVLAEQPSYAHFNSRPCRYWHAEHAPAGATPVKPASDPHSPSAPSTPKRAGGRALEPMTSGARRKRPRASAQSPAHQLLLDLAVDTHPSERRAAA